ncbi:uncharacterized protein KD926_000180 [Aspergillus affinis]|uniref:uncharacterized protein n=1 Tax=Aspergillus affinis TaxID=1070780 RepID=UPI0022FDE80B|nr:uncharacterized protein KD926_000180 [Aspergillus affinis]KAI9037618.1 hypothetical protein KD926_000180 [Aspergillus affinis]
MELQLPPRGVKREREDEDADAHSAEPPRSAMRPTDSNGLLNLCQNFRLLPVPEDKDDLETTARKMEDLAREVDNGNSLALYTGLQVASQRPRNPESIAKAHLAPHERWLYDCWRKSRDSYDNAVDGMRLPDFNWDKWVAPLPNGMQSLNKFRQRAEAMDRIWGHHGATAEHASWLTYHLPSMLPLVKAVTKVTNLQRNNQPREPREPRGSRGAHPRGLTDMEVAELETARKVVAAAEKNRCRETEKIRRLTRSIANSVTVMKSRVHTLEERRHGRL